MKELQIFKNEKFGEIRVTTKNGEPWFVANDVCRILDLCNPRQALARLDEDEKGVILTDTIRGMQELNAVNEPGLYTLVLGSRKPEAKEFRRWLTHDVIPAIRKTGTYGLPDFTNPVIAARAWADVMEDKQIAEAKIKQLAPKAAITEAFIERNHAISFRTLAHELGIREKILRPLLEKHKIIYKQGNKWKPYADMVAKGYMVVKDVVNNSTGYTAAQPLYTMEGKEYIRQKLLKDDVVLN